MAPGVLAVAAAVALSWNGQMSAADIQPSATSVTCAPGQLEYWKWDHYTNLWGHRCIDAAVPLTVVLASEGDVVAFPLTAHLQPATLALIDQTFDVLAETAGATGDSPIQGSVVWGRLKKSSSCPGVDANVGDLPVDPAAGCDHDLNPPSDADAKAPENALGSVGSHTVAADAGNGTPMSFSWDISRWTKGDVFAGIFGGYIKVYDRDFKFKRYLATSDRERYAVADSETNPEFPTFRIPGPNTINTLPDGSIDLSPAAPWLTGSRVETNQDAQYYGTGDGWQIGQVAGGCAVNFRTGEMFLANYDWYDPGINVIGRQPGATGATTGHGDLPYSDLSRRLSTARFRANDINSRNPIDANPESLRFDRELNLYVGHSGPYYTGDGSTVDIEAPDTVSDDGAHAPAGHRVSEYFGTIYDGTDPIITNDGRPLGLVDAGGGAMTVRRDPHTVSTIVNPADRFTFNAYWEDAALAYARRDDVNPFAWLLNTLLERIPSPRLLGRGLHRYNYSASGAPYSTSNVELHLPFASRTGVDWIDLLSPQDDGFGHLRKPTVLYTSEYGDIYQYDSHTNTQLPDFNMKRLYAGRLHALRLLPPGDGTDLIVAGNDVEHPENNGIFRVRKLLNPLDPNSVDPAGVPTIAQTYTIPPEIFPGMTTPGQPFWYAVDISPDGKTLWASAFRSNDLYQFDVETGASQVRHVASFPGDQYGSQGLCIMWQYNTQQEICGNGQDDDGDDIIDNGCAHIPSTPDVLIARDDAYTTKEGVTLTVTGLGLRVNDGSEFNRSQLTTTVETPPAHGGLTLNSDGTFQYQPQTIPTGFHGVDTFTYVAHYGTSASAPATVTIVVTPLVTDDSYLIPHGTLLEVAASGVLADDSSGMTVTAAGPSTNFAGTQPIGVEFSTQNGGRVTMTAGGLGGFTYRPWPTFAGVDFFYYRANDGVSDATNTDGQYGSAAKFAKVLIDVTNNATAPTAKDNAYATSPGDVLTRDSSRNIILNTYLSQTDSDPDNDPLFVNGLFVVGGPDAGDHSGRIIPLNGTEEYMTCLGAGGRLKLWWNGEFEYHPRGGGCPAAVGNTTATFQYTVTDGVLTSAQATVSITLSGNEAPVAYDNAYATLETVLLDRSPSRNVLLNPDDHDPPRTDFDPDAGDTLHVAEVWANDPDHFINPATNEPWDCATAAGLPHCVSIPVQGAAGTDDRCLNAAGGGSLNVWTNGEFRYDPRSSACTYAQGPVLVWFWYRVSDNHDPGEVSGLAKVTITVTAPLFVTADDHDRLYGVANPPVFGYSITGFRHGDTIDTPGLVSGSVACGTDVATSALSPVGPYDITCAPPRSNLTSTLYTVIYQVGHLRVLKAPLTITADATEKTYGQANPPVGYSLTGFVNGDTEDVVSGAAVCSTTAGPNVGVYPAGNSCLAGDLDAHDYEFTNFVAGQHTITLKLASVTPDANSKIYGTGDPALTGTLSGFLPGDNVVATYARDAGETVLGGPYTIRATLSPSGVLSNYDITNNTASFTINVRPVSVTPAPNSKVYDDPDPALFGSLSGFVAGDNVTASYSRVAGETVAGGPYTISATLSPVGVLSNYNVTYNTALFTITPKAAVVTPAPKTKIYGDSDPALTGNLSGFVATDNVVATYARVAGETVLGGPYTISATLGPAGVLSNYEVTYNTAALTITVRPASVTPAVNTKIYGDTDPALTGSLSGFLAGDSVVATYARTAGETVLGGPYTISATLGPAGVLSNYDVTYSTAAFTITVRPASVTPAANTKIYGDTDPALTGSMSGFLAGDNVVATYARTAGETVLGGPYTISATLGPAGVLSNYDVTYNTAAFTITARPASVTPAAKTKIYGENDPALTGALSGFVAGDNVAASYSRVAGETVLGGPYLISATLGPAGVLSNYTVTYNTALLTITPKAVSVTPAANSKVYGGDDPTLAGTLSGFLAGDNVVATYARAAGETVLGGPYTISATLSPVGVLSNYTITYNTALFTITPKAASVTPAGNTKVYGTSDPALTGTLTGFLAADNVTATYARATGETVLGGPYTISATLAPTGVLSNYAVTSNTALFTITPKAASVTPAADTKIYGGTDPAFTGALSGFLAGDNVVATYARTAGETVLGGPYAIGATLSPAGVLGNYSITYNTALFTITPRAASVTPAANTKVYGNGDPALTGALSGFLAADNVVATYARTAGETVLGGPYAIGATLGPAGVLSNYNVTYNTAAFTITVRPASVTPAAKSKAYGDTDPALTGTLSGFLAGDNVVASYSRVAGESVTTTPAGYEISATLSPAAALANYTVTYNTGAFTITVRPASVTPAAKTKIYGDTDPALTGTLSGFLAGDNVVASYSRVAGENVTTTPAGYAISATLSPAAALANYSVTYNTGAFTITPKTASVTPAGNTKVYGTSDPALTGAVSGFLAGDNVVASYGRAPGETVTGGPYTMSATLGPAGVLGNYSITYNTALFTITPKAASVTTAANTKIYGGTDPTFTGALSGFLAGDNVTATYGRAAGETVLGGPYAIGATLSPAGVLGNYSITYNTAPFTITPKTASVTPAPNTKVYGTADPGLTGTLSGFLAGDSVVASYSRAAGETVLGGPYAISATLTPIGVLSNYSIMSNTALFTITTAPLSVTASSKTRIQGVANPTLDGVLAGVVAGDNITATYSTTATISSLVGIYPITPALVDPSGRLSNYAVTIVPGTLTVLTAVCPGTSSFVSFNMQSTAAGRILWFSSVFKLSGATPTIGSHLYVTSAHINFGSTVIAVPDSEITFTAAGIPATTTFDVVNNKWLITVPYNFGDNIFLGGVQYVLPAAIGNNTATTWTAAFTSDVAGVTPKWKGAAAAYPSTQFGAYNTIGVKTVHSTSADAYHNGDQAGTPEAVKSSVVSGGTGGGGSNYTGSYSNTVTVTAATNSCQ